MKLCFLDVILRTIFQPLSGTTQLLPSLNTLMNQSIVGDITSSCISNNSVNTLPGKIQEHFISGSRHKIFRKYNSKFCLHLACLAFDKDYRGKDNIGTHIIGMIMKVWYKQWHKNTVYREYSPSSSEPRRSVHNSFKLQTIL